MAKETAQFKHQANAPGWNGFHTAERSPLHGPQSPPSPALQRPAWPRLRSATGVWSGLAAALASVLNKLFDLAPPVLKSAWRRWWVGQTTELLARPGSVSVGVPSPAGPCWGCSRFLIGAPESLFEYLYGLLWRNLARPCNTSCAWRPTTISSALRWPSFKPAAAAVCWPIPS